MNTYLPCIHLSVPSNKEVPPFWVSCLDVDAGGSLAKKKKKLTFLALCVEDKPEEVLVMQEFFSLTKQKSKFSI